MKVQSDMLTVYFPRLLLRCPKVIINCRPATVPTVEDAVLDEGRSRLTNGDLFTARNKLLKNAVPVPRE